MIEKAASKEQLNICLDIIHKSFATVAKELNLTIENCPSHTAFMSIEKLKNQYNSKIPMFLYKHNDKYVGYFSLLKTNEAITELNNLAVLPDYRHLGIGKDMIEFAKKYAKEHFNTDKITIGIIDENIILKEWYKSLGFVHTGTKNFEHLPFTVGFMEIKL